MNAMDVGYLAPIYLRTGMSTAARPRRGVARDRNVLVHLDYGSKSKSLQQKTYAYLRKAHTESLSIAVQV